jgi:hypothetical protein
MGDKTLPVILAGAAVLYVLLKYTNVFNFALPGGAPSAASPSPVAGITYGPLLQPTSSPVDSLGLTSP